MRIEKRYTKEEIFTFYCNQIYFGHGAYGVEAASQLYFRKAAKDLVARRGRDALPASSRATSGRARS